MNKQTPLFTIILSFNLNAPVNFPLRFHLEVRQARPLSADMYRIKKEYWIISEWKTLLYFLVYLLANERKVKWREWCRYVILVSLHNLPLTKCAALDIADWQHRTVFIIIQASANSLILYGDLIGESIKGESWGSGMDKTKEWRDNRQLRLRWHNFPHNAITLAARFACGRRLG